MDQIRSLCARGDDLSGRQFTGSPAPNAKDRVGASMTDQWGEMLITGWNKAGGWICRAALVTELRGF